MRLRRRWFTTLQNFEFEIQATQGQIDVIDKEGGLSEDQQKILSQCKSLLQGAKETFGSMFPRELFVWQSLFLIQQNMLLILPHPQLRAKWRTLSDRLSQLGDEAARASLKRRSDDISKRLGEC